MARRAVDGVDFVLHQAAIPSVPRSVQDPRRRRTAANIDATLNVLVAARDADVKRVVYAGSSSAYGDTPTLPKVETMPTAPLSPYALQKLVGEQYCQMFTRLYGLETVTIRYFNVFGPRQDPSSPYSGVISLFISALCEGRQPTIYGDGEQTRDFTYVANVVDGVLRACRGTKLRVRSDQRRDRAAASPSTLCFETVRDLVGAQRGADLRRRAPATFVIRRPISARPGGCSATQPDVTFEEGLKRTVEWYRTSQPTVA